MKSEPHTVEQRTHPARRKTHNSLTEALTNDGYTIVQETAFVAPGSDT